MQRRKNRLPLAIGAHTLWLCVVTSIGANDQGMIAFTSMRTAIPQVYTTGANGGPPTQLTDAPKPSSHAEWSPDGSRIVFHSVRDGDVEVYSMRADGSDTIRLTNRPGVDAEPVWSRDGWRIAFVRVVGWQDQRVFAMDADGANATSITAARQVALSPTWSPDGDRIAYAAQGDVWSMKANGKNVRQLTQRPNAGEPAWSPDGSRIAFADGLNGAQDVYIMSADGEDEGRAVPVTRHPGQDSSPAWSPDGERIAFVTSRDDGVGDIYVLALQSGNVQRLTADAAYDGSPAWYGAHSERAVTASARELSTWGWLKATGR